MHAQTILLALALTAVGRAQDIDNNGIPSQCSAVCSGLAQLTETCNNQSNDDKNDANYLDCVCNSTGVSTQLPLCEACVAQFDDDGRDTDVNDLLTSCSFSTTTYNPSSSYASTSIAADATWTSSSSADVIVITGTNSASTTQSTDSSEALSALSSLLSSITAGASTTGGTSEQSTNAAPRPTLGPKVMGAGVGLGLVGLALGMA